MSNPSVMANYPDGIGHAKAPWNQPDGHMNDGKEKVFTVSVELYITATDEWAMDEVLGKVGEVEGVLDMDDQKILEWRHL